jgi:hypothetical protein
VIAELNSLPHYHQSNPGNLEKEENRMRKIACLFLVFGLAISFSSIGSADEFQIIGREISAGMTLANETVGAVFVGKFYSADWAPLGRFALTLDHDGQYIEACGFQTQLLRFKLVMNFDTGARLVLLGPEGIAYANWDWDDPDCQAGNCPLIKYMDYEHYIELFTPAEPPNLIPCTGPDAFIAEVTAFDVERQRFGSYGVSYKTGTVNGFLVHTPIVSPAIFGTLSLNGAD